MEPEALDPLARIAEALERIATQLERIAGPIERLGECTAERNGVARRTLFDALASRTANRIRRHWLANAVLRIEDIQEIVRDEVRQWIERST